MSKNQVGAADFQAGSTMADGSRQASSIGVRRGSTVGDGDALMGVLLELREKADDPNNGNIDAGLKGAITSLVTQEDSINGRIFPAFDDDEFEKDYIQWWWSLTEINSTLVYCSLIWAICMTGILLVFFLESQPNLIIPALAIHGAHSLFNLLLCLFRNHAVFRRDEGNARISTIYCTLFHICALSNLGIVMVVYADPAADYIFMSPTVLVTFVAIMLAVLQGSLVRLRASLHLQLGFVDVVVIGLSQWLAIDRGWHSVSKAMFVPAAFFLPIFLFTTWSALVDDTDRRRMYSVLRKQEDIAQMLAVNVGGLLDRSKLQDDLPHDFSKQYNALHKNFGIDAKSRKFPEEINRSQIQVQELLGSGAFGEVRKGTFQSSSTFGMPVVMPVAIKSAKYGDGISALLDEAALMAQFDNRYVVRLIGVCTTGHLRGKQTWVVMEYCENGVLRKFLQQHTSFRVLTLQAKLAIALDIASGMEYLASHSFVHRDLAARNVLVDKAYVCKVADFGMSRDLGNNNDYYRSKGGAVPVRWTACEALEANKFTEASDVWSYGITLYEVFTGGSKPYKGMSNQQVWIAVKDGYRLPRPDECPQDVYDTILAPCWKYEASDRVTFETLVASLLEMVPVEHRLRHGRISRAGSSSRTTSTANSGLSGLSDCELTDFELRDEEKSTAASRIFSYFNRTDGDGNSGHLDLEGDDGFMEYMKRVANAQVTRSSTSSAVSSLDNRDDRSNTSRVVDDALMNELEPQEPSLLELEIQRVSGMHDYDDNDSLAEYLNPEPAPLPPPRASKDKQIIIDVSATTEVDQPVSTARSITMKKAEIKQLRARQLIKDIQEPLGYKKSQGRVGEDEIWDPFTAPIMPVPSDPPPPPRRKRNKSIERSKQRKIRNSASGVARDGISINAGSAVRSKVFRKSESASTATLGPQLSDGITNTSPQQRKKAV